MKAFLIAPLLLLASCSQGDPDISVTEAWVRETVAGQSGTAAYMTVQNRGSGDDQLVEVTAPAPIVVSLHETTTEGGVSRMRALDNGLAIPAGATVPFKPGGAHVMVSGLTAPLREGDVLRVTLRFERSGDKAVDFKVAPATGGADH